MGRLFLLGMLFVAFSSFTTGISSLNLTNYKLQPLLGQWTGWVLFGNCWFHGTFTYFGEDPWEWNAFIPDPNPYIDGYSGNEPVCLLEEQNPWC